MSKYVDRGDSEELVRGLAESEGSVSSAVLVEAMGRLSASGAVLPEGLLEKLASKSRVSDAMPSVTAAYIALGSGDTSLAAELLAGSSGSQEIRNRALALTEVYLREGDTENARRSAEKVYGADPGCERAYQVLEELDPEGGWSQRHNIQRIMCGERPECPPGSGKFQELYSIYYDWFTGRRDAASGRMAGSDHYKARDPEFLLASARFSVDERDWRSAKMVYDSIIDGSPAFVRCEAAEAYLDGGEPRRALEIFESADRTLPRVRAGIIRAYVQMGARKEMMDAVRSYLDSEFVHLDDYIGLVRMLMDMDLYEEAGHLVDRISEIYPKESRVLTCRSAVMLHGGDVPGAFASARRAVMYGRKDPAARIQRARMFLVTGKAEVADRECNSVLGDDPGNRDAMSLLKDIAFSRGDDRAALEVCDRILESDPSDVGTMKSKALALCRLGDCEGASEVLGRCMVVDPTRDNSVDVVGMMLEHGMFGEAVHACNELSRSHPDDPEIRRLRGNAEYGTGDYLKASVSFASAAELLPDDPEVWYSKGMADEARGDLQSAEDAYGRALMLDLDRPEFWIARASVKEARGDTEGAVFALNRAMLLDPDSIYPLVKKATIMSAASRHEEAMRLMELAMQKEPGDTDVRRSYIPIAMAAGRYEEAAEVGADILKTVSDSWVSAKVDECRAAVTGTTEDTEDVQTEEAPEESAEQVPEEQEPEEDPDSLASMASSLLLAGDRKGAVRMIDRALDADPDNPEYIIIKARAVLASGDRGAATVMVTSAIRNDPNRPELHEMLGDLRVLAGDNGGALQEYETALAQGADTADLRVKMGNSFERVGNTDGALECYTAVADRGEAQPDTIQKLVRILLSRNDTESAGTYIDRMLETDPNDASAWVLRAELAKVAGDADGVTEAYSGFSRCTMPGADSTVRMVKLLEETGHPDLASEVMGEKTVRSETDRSIKRYAEKVMRRAVTTKTELLDPDLLMSMGLDPDVSEQVSMYISDMPEYGRITPGNDDFRMMERQSHDIIMKLKWTDLENQPRLPLERVFVAGSFRDADDAKMLVAYIYKVMHYDVGRKADGRITSMSMRLPRGMTVYDVVKECDVGVYEAKQVLAQIV